jgi:hypothetical protein
MHDQEEKGNQNPCLDSNRAPPKYEFGIFGEQRGSGVGIIMCMCVTIDGVWIFEWIYWPLTGRNYK